MPGIDNVINIATAALLTETFGWEVANFFDERRGDIVIMVSKSRREVKYYVGF